MRTPRTINLKILMAFLLTGFIFPNLILVSFAQYEPGLFDQPSLERQEFEKELEKKTEEEAKKEIISVKCPSGSMAHYDDSGKFLNCIATVLGPEKCVNETYKYYKDGKFIGCIVKPTEVIRAGDIKKMEGIELQPYETSVDIPCQPIAGGKCPEPTTLAGYIARLYQFGLMIAGLTAFGAIVFGALKYILSAGSMANQQDARDQITQAIIGLILLLGAYLILYTINPDLVNLRNPSAEIIDIEKIIQGQEKNIFVGKEQELPTDESEIPLVKNCKTAMRAQITVGGEQKVRIDCRKCIEGYERQEDEDGTTWCKAIGID